MASAMASMASGRGPALLVAALGAAGCAVAALLDPDAALRGWLAGLWLWLAASLGALGFGCVHGLTGGRWGEAIGPALRAMRRPLPLLALLFAALALDLGALYPWARDGAGAHPELLAHRAPYLNVPGFWVRAAAAFALWIGADALLRRHRAAAGPALIVLTLTLTVVATDWIISLETAFFSTVIGLTLLAAAGTVGLGAAIALTAARGGLPDAPKTRRDLGNLLLAMVLLTAYCAFSQLLIIWAADRPDENAWYLHRSRHGWRWLAVGLAVGHIAGPFFALLSRAFKEHTRGLASMASWLVAMQAAYAIWLVTPGFGAVVPWPEVCAMAAIGGLWLWVVLGGLRREAP